MKEYLTIGEISKITRLPVSTLRYYDSEGIISPAYKDENTNYRYYRFFQVPILKMIVHLKKLGFSNSSIKSHLENLSYTHTLNLMTKMLEQTREEINRLKNLEIELEENALQMKYFIKLENNLDKFFIEEEEIRGIYEEITEDDWKNGVSSAFKKIDSYLSNCREAFIPVGICAFILKKENVELKKYIYDKLVVLKDLKECKKRYILPKQKYLCLISQGKFEFADESIEKVIKESQKRKYEIIGDVILHILSGPAFEKNPEEAMYIIKVPIKISDI